MAFPKRITVFTPTYNRAYRISDLFHSLQRQSFRDFEWIVIDDGSTDNTEELFQQFRQQADFDITYKKVPNGGKHRAINKGVKMASGELFFIVDSDDYLTDDALEIIDGVEKTIPETEKGFFAGVCGDKGYNEQQAVGTSYSGTSFLDITTLEREKNNVFGDKSEVFYTEVLKKYPFPEFDGEKFIGENVVWNKIAYDGLKLRFFNQIIYICEYLPDGLTAHYHEIYINNPKGWALIVRQQVQFCKLSGLKKWRSYSAFYSALKKDKKLSEIAGLLQVNTIIFWFEMVVVYLSYKAESAKAKLKIIKNVGSFRKIH